LNKSARPLPKSKLYLLLKEWSACIHIIKDKMRKKTGILILFLGFAGISQFLNAQNNPCDRLIFKSGFEPGTIERWDGTNSRASDYIGYDSITGFDWVEDLEAEGRTFFMNYVDHTNGVNPELLGSYIDNDPDDSSNHVFYTYQNGAEWQDGEYWARIQGELNNCKFSEVYYKIRIRIDSAVSVLNGNDWWIWGMLYEIGKDYRGSVRIFRNDLSNQLSWGYYGRYETSSGRKISKIVSDVPVKFNTWQTIEFYINAGDENSGKYWIIIDGDTIISKQERTVTGNEEIWETMSLFKVYGNMADVLTDPEKGNKDCMKVWYDDFELWASDIQAPKAPSDLQAIAISDHQVDVTWIDNTEKEDFYWLERKTKEGSFQFLNILQSNDTSYSDINVSPGTTYTYRVYANSSTWGNSDYSNEATVTTYSSSNEYFKSESIHKENYIIYPNPLSGGDDLYIRTNDSFKLSKQNILIYDISGRQLYSSSLNSTVMKNNAIIIPGNIINQQGLFILKIVGDNEVYSRKFIIK